MLAFTSGKVDMTFTAEMTVPLTKQVLQDAPQAICKVQPTNTPARIC